MPRPAHLLLTNMHPKQRDPNTRIPSLMARHLTCDQGVLEEWNFKAEKQLKGWAGMYFIPPDPVVSSTLPGL